MTLPQMNPQLVIASLAVAVTLGYASILDLRDRRVPFRTWYPMLAIAAPMAAWTYLALFISDTTLALGIIGAVALFCGLFYFLAAYVHLFGGADAWAMIFITACIPLFPFEPLFGNALIGFFPLVVFMNAVILNIATPIGIFLMNIIRGNRAPLHYMFVGFPVDGDGIENTFGFVMEDFGEHDGELTRRFITFRGAMRRMIDGDRRMYTRDLKRNPDQYARELDLYRRAGTVWISYGVPFIVPITAGFLTAVFFGDLIYVAITTIYGV
ncbi:MAG: A24 family peptidase C-terminal domain-containing protein [Methanomicrobiaceae archaeon]|nr:A24 family peptidase C-terminal domain-containing protein [Methanomicrobiaceae archaeon]